MRRRRYAAFALVTTALALSVAAASQPTVSIPEFWNEALLHDY